MESLINRGHLANCAFHSVLVRAKYFEALTGAVHVAGGFKAAEFLLGESAGDDRFNSFKELRVDAFDFLVRQRNALVFDAGGATNAEILCLAEIVRSLSLV